MKRLAVDKLKRGRQSDSPGERRDVNTVASSREEPRQHSALASANGKGQSTSTSLEPVIGNAATDSADYAQWFVGHFVSPETDPRHVSDLEIKWGIHEPGDGESEWTVSKCAKTLSLLVRGRVRISFGLGDYLLDREGDYVLWPEGIPHRWHAEESSVVLTLRWPSLPGDSVSSDNSV